MARRHEEETSISLFPFLSILCCVIGVLTLLIAAIALGQIDEEKDDDTDVALQYQDLMRKNKQDWNKLEKYKEYNEKAATIRLQLTAAKTELEKLQAEYKQRDTKLKLDEKTQKALNTKLLAETSLANKRVAELKPELDELNKSIAELKSKVKEKKKPKEATVVVRPSGSGKGLIPVFVECAKTELIVHGRAKEIRVRQADLSTSKEFRSVLKTVKAAKNATVVFLLRDDGISTYRIARQLARSEYVNNGKLALIGHGELDLRLFKKR